MLYITDPQGVVYLPQGLEFNTWWRSQRFRRDPLAQLPGEGFQGSEGSQCMIDLSCLPGLELGGAACLGHPTAPKHLSFPFGKIDFGAIIQEYV